MEISNPQGIEKTQLQDIPRQTRLRVARRILPYVFLLYVIAYLDRARPSRVCGCFLRPYARGHQRLAKPRRSSLSTRFPQAHRCSGMADLRRRRAPTRDCPTSACTTSLQKVGTVRGGGRYPITCENVPAPELAHGEFRCGPRMSLMIASSASAEARTISASRSLRARGIKDSRFLAQRGGQRLIACGNVRLRSPSRVCKSWHCEPVLTAQRVLCATTTPARWAPPAKKW
jgi:hypothetical protein